MFPQPDDAQPDSSGLKMQDYSEVALLDQYQTALQSGMRPSLVEYATQVPGPERDTILRELLKLDFNYRRKTGEVLQTSDYSALLPELQTEINELFASCKNNDTESGDSTDQVDPQGATICYQEPQAVNPPPPQIGRYQILGEIARGGMGVVYKARDSRLGRIAAVKVIRSGAQAAMDEVKRFQVEGRAAAGLEHPGIVPVYEVDEDAGQLFMAMAYIDGESLWQKVKTSPLTPRMAAQIMRQIAVAVEYAHSRGILHRDLKPQNILLTSEGQPKVTDFGLAKHQGEDSNLTANGEVLGTPSYMPPEQASGRLSQLGPSSDVYSLGATLYYVLVGRPPFQAATALETLRQVIEQEPVALRALNPAIPRDLETICMKCLHKDSGKRYPSAQALADELDRFLADQPIQARPVTTVERFHLWCRRNPKLGLLIASVIVVVIAWGSTATVLAIQINLQKHQTELARISADNNAQTATANMKTAEKNFQLAVQQQEQTIVGMVQLGEKFYQRLSTRGMSTVPAVREARDDLLQALRTQLVDVSSQPGLSSFGSVKARQVMGDLLRKLGRGDEAQVQYQAGYDLVRKIVDAHPDSDQARGNLGVMLILLGDIRLEYMGDAAGAREKYQAAYDLQKFIQDHPRDRSFTDVDNWRIVSSYAMKLGQVALALGDLAAARARFQEAVAFRQDWTQRQPDNVPAQSYLSESEMFMGLALGRMGDVEAARSHLESAVAICESLSIRFPKAISFKSDLSEVYGSLGDFQLQQGQLDAAATSYQKLREHLAAVLNSNPEDMSRQPFVAQTHERVASLSRSQGNDAEVARRFEEARKVREDLMRFEPNNQTWKAAYVVSLARTGKIDEAARIVDDIIRDYPGSIPLLIQSARCLAICAKKEANAERQREFAARSNAVLNDALSSGYLDRRAIEEDVELAAIKELLVN